MASYLHLPSKLFTRICRDRDFLVRRMRICTAWYEKLSQADMNSHFSECPLTYHSTTSISFIPRSKLPIRRRATTLCYWMWNINNCLSFENRSLQLRPIAFIDLFLSLTFGPCL